MASPVEKLEEEVEIKSSADKFFQTFGKEAHKVPKICPASYQAIYLHEGDWETHGSVKQWHYTVDGKQEVFKEKTEIDETDKSTTLVGLEGHVMEMYKSVKITLHPIPKQGGSGSVVKLTFQYEKARADVPPPNNHMKVIVNMIKDVDAHLVKA